MFILKLFLNNVKSDGSSMSFTLLHIICNFTWLDGERCSKAIFLTQVTQCVCQNEKGWHESTHYLVYCISTFHKFTWISSLYYHHSNILCSLVSEQVFGRQIQSKLSSDLVVFELRFKKSSPVIKALSSIFEQNKKKIDI